ncbi:MAG: SRPBCC domain-containing protein [Planctomycetota bacterium]
MNRTSSIVPKRRAVIACTACCALLALGMGVTRVSSIDTSLFVDAGPDVRTIEADRIINAPPEVVFEQLTTEQGVKAWLGVDSHVQLAIGGAYELYFEPDRGRGFRGTEGSQVLSYAPGRMLSVSWNVPTSLAKVRGLRTWVTFIVEPVRTGSRVSVTHAGFGDTPGWTRASEHYRTGWPTVLATLKRSLEPTAD